MIESTVRVLIVEDDEDDYIIVRKLLEQAEGLTCELVWVTGSDEARREMQTGLYDVYLVDYKLDVSDGLELLRWAVSHVRRAPVILLTGQGDPRIDMQALQSGAADYIVKGQMSSPLLARSIRYAIGHYRAEEALRKAHADLERRVVERTAELASANERLQRQSEELKFFAYSVLHDLKSPSIAVHGLSSRLRRNWSSQLGEEGRTCCVQIMKATEQIATLVDKINVYISAKEAPLRRESLRFEEVVDWVAEEFRERLLGCGVHLVKSIGVSEIHADRLAVMRVLRNLVDNALKYGGRLISEVEVGTREAAFHHVLYVKDDGIGIDREQTSDLFERFTRRNVFPAMEGSGLGLAIVREIAERHGGEAWVEFGEGRETTFCISIPTS